MIRGKMCKIASALLTIAMLTSMIACGKTETKQEPASTETKAVETKTDETAASSDGPWEKYESPIKITIVQGTTTNTKFENDDTIDDNIWTREVEKVFNIKTSNLWTADNSQYANKMNLSIASGDLPDVFWVNSTQFAKISKTNMILDLTELYEKYASPELKQVEDSDKIGYESGMVEGKLMGLSLQHFGTISLPNVVWIRDDWMKKLGLEAPKTLDELLTICEAFTTKDPDGNNKNDTYGLAVHKDLYGGLSSIEGIFNACHAYPMLWIKDSSGKITYGSIQPEMKTALGILQDMYKKGLISKEFGVKDTGKVNEDLIAGKVGVEIGANWNGFWPIPDVIKKNGPEAIFMPYSIPSADDKPIKLSAQWPVSGYAVVNKNCKNPEAAMKLANLYVQKFHSQDSEEWVSFFSDDRGWLAPIQVNDPKADYNQFVAISGAIEAKDKSKLRADQLAKYELATKWIDTKDPVGVGSWLQQSPVGSYSILKNFVDSGNLMLTEYRGVDTDTLIEKRATLEKLENETITKIIMGDPIENFDKMVETWKKLGGDAVIAEMNEMYNK